MPPPYKPAMRIVSFVDYADIIGPRRRTVDGDTIARLRDSAINIQRREPNANGDVFTFTILKNRDASARIQAIHDEILLDETPIPCVLCDAELPPTPGGKAIEYETSFRIRLKPNAALEARRRIREQASAFRPTAWEHLLRDEGLG